MSPGGVIQGIKGQDESHNVLNVGTFEGLDLRTMHTKYKHCTIPYTSV